MRTADFIELVREMRNKQRDYFDTKSKVALLESRRLEKMVDTELMKGFDEPVFALVKYRTTNGVYVDGAYEEVMQFDNIMDINTDNIKTKAKHHSSLPHYRGAGIIIDEIQILPGTR